MSVIGHGVEVCTSTTRPTPTEGSLIYETDTKKLMLWNGSAWNETIVDNISTEISSPSNLSLQTSGTTRMGIDTSGRVTMPYQPAASGWMNNNSGSVANTFYIANNLTINRGSPYNTANGRFFCPVSGAYAAFFQAIAWASPGYGYVDLYKNGSGTGIFGHYNLTGLGGGNNWANINVNGIINCSAGDYLQFYIRVVGGNQGIYGAAHNSFSIFLLG